MRRRARLTPALEGLNDDHVSTAAWAQRAEVVRFVRHIGCDGRCDREQPAGVFEMGLAGGACEQAIVTDAVEALRQDVEQEAADKVAGGEGHDLLPVGAVATVVLVAEGDAGLVEAEKAAVRDRHAVV